jgi:hypothetical protein
VGVVEVMVIRVAIETWVIGKGGTKKEGGKRGMVVTGFCGPCACLGVFLLL